VRRNLDLAIATATFTAIDFDTVVFDPLSMWSVVTPTRITIPFTGRYMIGATGGWTANATGFREFILRVNNNAVPDPGVINHLAVAANQSVAQTVYTITQLNTNDFFELIAFQTSGIGISLRAIGVWSPVIFAQWLAQ